MLIKNENGVVLEKYSVFENCDWFKACFSTRVGGVSTDFLESMNLSFIHDTHENVHENFRRLCEAAELSYLGVTYSAQTHSSNIRKITNDDRGNGLHKPKKFTDIDGIITNEFGITLTNFYADCVPVFFADNENRVIGIAHAGWRGTVDNIIHNMINEMKNHFTTNPENLLVAIGPSICCSCFEVDWPVAEEFMNKLDFSCKYINKRYTPLEKYFIDLKSINKRLLLNEGVFEDNIEISPFCTKCEDKLFFSHRRDGVLRGSMVAMMEIINNGEK